MAVARCELRAFPRTDINGTPQLTTHVTKAQMITRK